MLLFVFLLIYTYVHNITRIFDGVLQQSMQQCAFSVCGVVIILVT
jgi:hypothetical protein